jgi:uncharacterized MAPEG superfamily protein
LDFAFFEAFFIFLAEAFAAGSCTWVLLDIVGAVPDFGAFVVVWALANPREATRPIAAAVMTGIIRIGRFLSLHVCFALSLRATHGNARPATIVPAPGKRKEPPGGRLLSLCASSGRYRLLRLELFFARLVLVTAFLADLPALSSIFWSGGVACA